MLFPKLITLVYITPSIFIFKCYNSSVVNNHNHNNNWFHVSIAPWIATWMIIAPRILLWLPVFPFRITSVPVIVSILPRWSPFFLWFGTIFSLVAFLLAIETAGWPGFVRLIPKPINLGFVSHVSVRLTVAGAGVTPIVTAEVGLILVIFMVVIVPVANYLRVVVGLQCFTLCVPILDKVHIRVHNCWDELFTFYFLAFWLYFQVTLHVIVVFFLLLWCFCRNFYLFLNIDSLLSVLKFLNLLNLLPSVFIIRRCSTLLLKPTYECINTVVIKVMEAIPLRSDFD